MDIQELENLVKSLADKRLEVEDLKRPYTVANQELEELEGKIVATLKEIGKDSYKSEYGTITRVNKWRFNLPKTPEERASYFDFLKTKGVFENMISVNSNTHNSFCLQEWESAKQADPVAALDFRIPGVPEQQVYETLSFRKK